MDVRSQGLTELISDVVLQCNGGMFALGVTNVNISVSSNAPFTSRTLGTQGGSEALLMINEPLPGHQLLCAANTACIVTNGGTVQYDGAPGHPNVFQGTQINRNQITFLNVPIQPPGIVTSPNTALPVLTMRITNLRVAAGGLGISSDSPAGATAPVTVTVSSSAGFPIFGVTQQLGTVRNGLSSNVVSNQSSFFSCSSQTLQPAFTLNVGEGFATAFRQRISSSPSQPANVTGFESGFVPSDQPLLPTSPGVADSATRIKVTFSNIPSTVTLYVPLVIGSGIFVGSGGTTQSLTAILTASETGPFTALPASPGTNGTLAAVTNGVAIYEVVPGSALAQIISSSSIESLSVPVFLSYEAGTVGFVIGSVSVDFAPWKFGVEAGPGPIPAFTFDSPTHPAFSVASCSGISLSATAGNSQSAVVGSAFANTLQVTVRDASNQPVNGASVTFSAPPTGASGTFAGSMTVITNAQGIATSPQFIANSVAGLYTVSATFGGVSTNFSLANTPGAPAMISAVAGSSQVAAVNQSFTSPLQAKVTDAGGNPVPGTSVTFTAPASGASSTFSASPTVITNSQGIATSPVLTANSITGSYAITAATAALPPASFSITNLSGPVFNCAANGSTPLDVRKEGLSELVEDIILQCTGGFPTPAGQPVPTMTFSITANAPITSRLLSSSGQTEALLVVNEPIPASQLLCPIGSVCPLVADGNGGASGTAAYNGTPGHPNIFSGVRTSPNTITFSNIPIDAPGSAASTPLNTPGIYLRIANIRVAPALLSLAPGADPFYITLTASNNSGVTIANPVQIVGSLYSQGLGSFHATQPVTLSQCSAQTLQPAFSITVKEGFGTAFRMRTAAAGTSQANFTGTTESGYRINGLPDSPTSPGVADFGTRIRFSFQNVPAGATIYAPVTLQVPSPSGAPSMVATLVAGERAALSDPLPTPAINGYVAISNGTAVYEITSATLVSLATLNSLEFGFQLSYPTGTSAGTTTVAVDFAPVSSGTAAVSVESIPVFAGGNTPIPAFTIDACTPSSTALHMTSIGNHVYGDSPIPLSASSNSPAPITYNVVSGPAVVNGNILSITGAGSVTVQASQVATGSYIAASATQTFIVAKATPIITWPVPAAISATQPLDARQLNATANVSGSFVYFPPAGTFLSAGTNQTLTATFTPTNTASYNTATASVNITVMAVAMPQSITFPQIPDHVSTDAPFTLNATASSGLPVTYTVIAGPAKVSGNLVSLTGTGRVIMEATQAGNSAFAPAVPVDQNFLVLGPVPAVTTVANSATNLAGPLAPESYGTLFGTNLTTATTPVQTMPYPAQIGGVTLILTDAKGAATPMLLYYVSPTQINFLVPAGVAMGPAKLALSTGTGQRIVVDTSVAATSPGLFNAQTIPAQDQIYLVLYGTGFRNGKNISITVGDAPGTVVYMGAQAEFPGLDQLNARVPFAPFTFGSKANVKISVDGTDTNMVSVTVPNRP